MNVCFHYCTTTALQPINCSSPLFANLQIKVAGKIALAAQPTMGIASSQNYFTKVLLHIAFLQNEFASMQNWFTILQTNVAYVQTSFVFVQNRFVACNIILRRCKVIMRQCKQDLHACKLSLSYAKSFCIDANQRTASIGGT